MKENYETQKQMMNQMKELMEKQHELMEKMVELETARIRRLEVPQTILNSTAFNSDDNVNSETDNNYIHTNQNISITEFSETFRNLTQTLESKKNSSKLNIKRDYKLTKKVVLNVWLDYLHSELRSNDLLDIIDEKITVPEKLNESEVEKRKSLVRDIIINHLDEYYHKKILNLKDPKEIITKIREFRRIEANVTASSVRAQLYHLKIYKKENVNEFCDRFDTIIREYESYDTSVPLSEKEKRLLQLEAQKKSSQETRGPRLNLTQRRPEGQGRPECQSGPHAKCFRCNKQGYVAPNFPLAEYNLWYCYFCNAEVNHKGPDCPKKGAMQQPRRYDNIQSKDHTTKHNTNNYTQFRGNKNNRGRGNVRRGGGRGNFRGRVFKRGVNRGARGASQNALVQGATAYMAGTTKDINKNKTQTQIAFIADSGATDHIVNKGY